MLEKYDLNAMLEEIRKEDGDAQATKKRALSQDDIKRLVAERKKAKNGQSSAQS